LIGGGLGMFVAVAGVRTLVALSPPGLPRVGAIRLDTVVFAFGLALTTVVGAMVGAIPALQASRADLQTALQQGSHRSAGGQQWTRSTLVVAEVALALVLLVSAGLLLRSLRVLFAVDAGFDPSQLLTMQIQVSGRQFGSDAARERFFAHVLERVEQIPNVAAAALTSQLPLSGDLDGYGVHLEDERSLNDISGALRYAVTPGYLEAMRIPLRRGRMLDAHDVAGAPRVALVNEAFAKRTFPGRDPIGHRIRFGPEAGPPFTIVGVAGDVRQASLSTAVADAVYVAVPQWHWVDNVMSLVIRARGNAAALAPAARAAVWSVDRNQAIVRVATMEGLLARSEANRRFASIVFEAFGLVALMLAATGIYGVLAGSVVERTREIGVRSALGASRGAILALVARQSMTLTGLGMLTGMAGAIAASGALVTLLFGVSRFDPITYLGVLAILLAVASCASAIPAWRAARIDPALTLRAD
jgi:putative ABC transport system permease protein